MDKKQFDEIIRSNLVKKEGSGSFIKGKPYYTDKAFQAFVYEMQAEYLSMFESYYKGKGSELKAKDGKLPKMASVASSSRFCYLALRNLKDKTVEVEKPLRIKGIRGGTCPQMDAYIKADNAFIEVKCHEIFDSHKMVLSKQYWKYIFGDKNDFGFKAREERDAPAFEIDLSAFKFAVEPKRFDFKQFLCHLFGIAYPLDGRDVKDKAKLVYLFFKPLCDDTDVDTLFKELCCEIESVFGNEHIKLFCKAHNIELYAIAQRSSVMESLDKTGYIKLFPC